MNDDGVTLTLLGRGSVCINTGGEKVFPEEVEEVDQALRGRDGRRGGRRARREVGRGDHGGGLDAASRASTREALIEFVKQQLASYKAPKHVVFVDEVYRSPSGKADFKRTREVALAALGLATVKPA